MDISKILPQGKAGPGSEEATARKKKSSEGGLVGLVNIGNSCYMNSTLQALSNCPPFRQYFIDCHLPSSSSSSSSHKASDVIATLFKKMWTSERHPGHLSPRPVSSAMSNKMFKSSLQQDAQEFLRCLLTQLHDEIAIHVSDSVCVCGGLKSCDSCCQRNSVVSYNSHDSDSSNDSQSKLVASGTARHSPLSSKTSALSVASSRRSSPSSTPKFSLKAKPYGKVVGSAKSSTESLDREPLDLSAVYLVDLTTHTVRVHKEQVVDSGVASESSLSPDQTARKRVVCRKSSIVSEVFEGILESRVKCSACKKISVTREPFQDLSLPIPGRKEVAKFKVEKRTGVEEKEPPKSTLNRGFCSVWSFVTALTRDILVGPPTDIGDCLNAFFDASELKGDNKYYCSNCKSFQNSSKEMSIVKLPEVLCIHLKRFRFDTYFSGKISRHIAFPLSGLDMSAYLKQGAPTAPLYELSAVITHYGGAGGGHYVAFAKNAPRNAWYEFNDTHVHSVSADAVVGAEGYVLFYRCTHPSTSLAAQPLDIHSLMPRAAAVASHEVCYISRHWLHLLKHFTHPGPISQHEFACRHGGVLPAVALEEARSLTLPLRPEVWESLQQQYGGGPLVPQLDHCSSCQEHLKRLAERRKLEKETVQKLNSRGSKKPEPYLLSVAWLQQWQEFIKCSTLEVEPPPPIDNAALISSDGRLVEDECLFRRLSPAIWSFLHEAYGGGPAVVTSLEDCQSSELTLC